MSGYGQNRAPSAVAQDSRAHEQVSSEQPGPEWGLLENQGAFLADFDELDESEFGFLAAAHKRVSGVLDRAANSGSTLDDEVQQGLSSVKDTVEQLTQELRASGRVAGLLSPSELDGSFRDDPHSTYNRLVGTLLGFVDWYTDQRGYGGQALYKTDNHRAGDSAVAQLIGLLDESLNYVYREVSVGSAVVPGEMVVMGQVLTERKDQVGKVAAVVRLRFIHHNGQQARAAGVRVYVS